MSTITHGQRPRPLPTAPDTARWQSVRLADITYRNEVSGRTTTYAAFAADPFVAAPRFARLDAASLVDAVHGAARLSRSIIGASPRTGTGSARVAGAVAVLQAADGAYYATLLGVRAGQDDDCLPFGRGAAEPLGVTRWHPDLRAVVGADGWFDLTAPQPARTNPLDRSTA